jgi:tetratricopeptide (TPR) repeat protein
MKTTRLPAFLAALLVSATLLAEAPPPAAGPSRDEARQNAQKLMKAGNYKEAYDLYQKLATDPDESARQVGQDLEIALTCLQNLNRVKEADAFREKVAQVHAANWRALYAVARSYFNIDHSGTIVAGKFERGPHRGGGKYANVMERDRVRALQLMVKAMETAEKDFRGAEKLRRRTGFPTRKSPRFTRILPANGWGTAATTNPGGCSTCRT